MSDQRIITRTELRAMAKERGMKGYWNLRRLELAERLGIELSKKKMWKPTWNPRKEGEERRPRKEKRKPRKALRVEVVNSDGTTATYPSISKAAQALGVYTMQIYVMAARGDARLLD